MRALFKPQLKTQILHRRATAQRWSDDDRANVTRAINDLEHRIGESLPAVHFPSAGEYWMIATCQRQQLELAKTIAIVLSRQLPRRWIVVGKLMVRDERFYRRTGRFNLALKSARDIHLRRDLRRAIGNRRHEQSSDPS